MLAAAVTVLVDFVILTSHGVVPHASAVIMEGIETPEGEKVKGFYSACKDTCEVRNVVDESGTTFPRMDFCDCVAQLLVEDLTEDFATISDIHFALGDVRKVEAPILSSPPSDGHDALYALMRDPPAGAARAPGRITVWIAEELPAGPNHHLEGSTFLNQVLARDQPGAGVILLASVSRAGRRLSHEVGHIVGFHHTAGQGLEFQYTYDLCGEVAWPVLQRPTCEVNIMGGWYDGPFCCPGTEEGNCKPLGDGNAYGSTCCGEQCTHQCPAERPHMTFATPEHAKAMRAISECWAEHINATDAPVHVFSLLKSEDPDRWYVEDPPRPSGQEGLDRRGPEKRFFLRARPSA